MSVFVVLMNISEKRRRKDIRVIAIIDVIHKRFEDRRALLNTVAESNNVDCNVILLELLRELHHRLLVAIIRVIWGGGDKDDDALTEVLVLSVLQRELGDGQCRWDVDLATNFPLRAVHTAKNVSHLFCVGDKHFRAA
jgi:hypothetical protein